MADMADPLESFDNGAKKDNQKAVLSHFKDASEWFDEPDPPDAPVIKNLLEEGEMCAVVGQAKSCKSFFVLQMAICIATGRPFLGYDTVKHRVCVCNAEVSEREYKRRFKKMCDRLSISPKEVTGLLYIGNLKGGGTTWEGLLDVCKENECKVAIVDPFYQISQIDENNQIACHEAVDAMKVFQEEGITLIVVFHSPKGFGGDRQLVDMISGSSILSRFPESIIGIIHHADEKSARVIKMLMRNYSTPDPFTIVLNDGAFERAEGLAPTPETARSHGAKIANANRATKEEKREAILAVVADIASKQDYDGKGTPKGVLADKVKDKIESTLKKSIGDRNVTKSIELLIKNGELEQYESKEKHARKYVGEKGIIERWEAGKGGKNRKRKERNTNNKTTS